MPRKIMLQRKVILNVHMADKLIKRGFPVVELKPSNKVRGKAAVLFDATPEFIETLSELSEESRKYHQNK